MIRLLRASWVIARRDYLATVGSRTFLLFLAAPLLPLLFGGLFGTIASRDEAPAPEPPVLVEAPAAATAAILEARARLAGALGEDALPPLAGARAGERAPAMLSGDLAHPLLSAPADRLEELKGPISLIVAEARRPPPSPLPALATRATPAPPAPAASGQRDLARGAQLVLFVLTILLSGMLVSNLVEEKSSKIIELLAAAVPVDAIFLGKLVGMLAISLTGVLVWGSLAGGSALIFWHGRAVLPEPALGWPLFLALSAIYFATFYLLLGALYLGIGAQAGSVREVQTLALPLTFAQLLILGLAQAAVAHAPGLLTVVAFILPWSSPQAMLALAAMRDIFWPHLLGIAWQFVALALVIRVASRLFRRNILRSGRNQGLKPAQAARRN